MSEGVADTLAVNITNYYGLGRGFYYTDAPLRDRSTPRCGRSLRRDPPHRPDLRRHVVGFLAHRVHRRVRRRRRRSAHPPALRRRAAALDRYPSSLIEALATDDDDGDLSNGTPHECMIATRTPRTASTRRAARSTAPVWCDRSMARSRSARSKCTSRSRGSSIAAAPTTSTTSSCRGATARTASRRRAASSRRSPPRPITTRSCRCRSMAPARTTDDHVREHVDARLARQPRRSDLRGLSGETIPLYCTNFESGDPFTQGWTTTAAKNETSLWAWAVPGGGGATDSAGRVLGTHALVQAPDGDYAPNSSSSVLMPVVDVLPYSDVRQAAISALARRR